MSTALSTNHTIEQLPVTTLASGEQLSLQLHRLAGTGGGPTLLILGGVHGDEPLGVDIVRRAFASMIGRDFVGELLAVPVCNPLAFQALNRNTPLDGCNLNRVMPGNSSGQVTDQVASVIAQLLQEAGVTHLIDFHSGGNLATVDYAYMDPDTPEMAIAFGTPLLYDHSPYFGTTTGVGKEWGIQVMVSELGGGSQRIEYYADRGVRGVENVMRAIGMLPGEPSAPEAPQRVVHEIANVNPRTGGIMISEIGADRLGESVPKGTLLGTVHSPYTFEVLEELRAPFEPSVLILTRESMTVVSPGDYGFMLGNGATVAPLPHH